MMDWIFAHLEASAAAVVVISAIWTVILKADNTFKRHLSAEFATKTDLKDGLAGLDKKLDKVLLAFHVSETNKNERNSKLNLL